ncbi:exodeoxyribonuclease V subunit gamma [Silvimonas iriomotensis]|uniref:RecBCD enzyme subunit RecC n=1 Tax=Silvimonas iriomotensis TaxID=449662 RepID=A0ABQ2P7Z8_9NEIS|nr:exodeoxyribonuclease V subunit gamma [Silvimonas iriomotensis]GGP20335.1 RecBCD enzyme subunit RecC [Silvimonas iriomotensis]
MTEQLTPGLLVLHGNRLEDLRTTVFGWITAHPLAPLEEEILLVQSNSIAEWLKLSLAQETGISAAASVQLPSQFLWRTYRKMLGPVAVPPVSPLDKSPLAWRLMRILPTLLAAPHFAPLRQFLHDNDAGRLWQLAQKLADLFDQYQVYRADWLTDWAAGQDQLRRADGNITPLQEDQRWQAALWRALLADVPEHLRHTSRDAIHTRFIEAIQRGDAPVSALPRRVVLFGVSALPMQTLQALAALAERCQVILAVPNPCQFHWADIIDGRELLRAARRRHGLRSGVDLSRMQLSEMHAQSNPLLAAWGRQGRDFVRMLDEFDDALAAQQRFPDTRIDLFDDGPGTTMLAQVQARIRDLQAPDGEHTPVSAADRSIVFHVAHSAQREVEILHDQLLDLFAQPDPQSPLTPRDVVVMVPDIETFAPAIEAVFGQYERNDPRFVPWLIADQKNRGINPLLKALEWLLRLPEQRCRLSEVRDLFDVPALARRFGVADADLERLAQWSIGAGVRWGLSGEQRAQLGLAAVGEQNSWLFGLRRMLLGFASGDDAPFAGIEPYGEVGGLDAAVAGSLAALVEQLINWSASLQQARTPGEWSEAGRALLAAFFESANDSERLTLIAVDTALQRWLHACELAGYTDPVALPVLREAWLGQVDEPTLDKRFLAGGVTFCTLLPMRAIPFQVVCLLGMNDGDYPRQNQRADFDLLATPGQYRPGDRSRRDDDRYLMLEALLAARRQLYISWAGHSPRDNSEQPASVLVSQLRDYLAANWQAGVVERLTTHHPLQPFSRRYFEGGQLHTWVREWRDAHQQTGNAPGATPDNAPETRKQVNLSLLRQFLANPVKVYFQEVLQVRFEDLTLVEDNEEPFDLDGLQTWQMVAQWLDQASATPDPAALEHAAIRSGRSGQLPIGPMGERERAKLMAQVQPMWARWLKLMTAWPDDASRVLLQASHADIALEDWLDGLRQRDGQTGWLMLNPGKLTDKKGAPRADKLLLPWLRQLVTAAAGLPMTGVIVARDAVLTLGQPDAESAQATLQHLLAAWAEGMTRPLPFAVATALAALSDNGKPADVYEGASMISIAPESAEPCLARIWPDFATLSHSGEFQQYAQTLFAPLAQWATEHIQVELQCGEDEEADHA